MKKSWQLKTLREVCEVFDDGNWIESKDQSPDGIRLIQTGNIGVGVFKDRAEKARYISESTFKRLRCTEVMEGDCLVSRLPDPVGRSCILPDTGEKMITAVDCTILRFNHKQIFPKFFNFYSQSDDYLTTVAKECTGTTRNRISRGNLGLTPIPVPPLDEQKRIVALLDEAFENIATAKANAEKNIQNAKALSESQLQSFVCKEAVIKKGGQIKTLGDICFFDKKQGIHHSLPYVGLEHIESHTARFIGLSEPYSVKSTTFRFSDKHVLYGRLRPYLNKALVPDFEGHCSTEIFPLKPSDNLLREYLLFWLLAEDTCNRINETCTGARMPRAQMNRVLGFEIPLPPLDEQKRIVAQLNSLRKEIKSLTAIYQRKLETLEALKKSLLQQAFAGKL